MQIKIDKGKLAKGLAQVLTTYSVGAVLTNIIDATTPAEIKPVQKVLVFLGSAILTGMVGDAATEYVVDGIEKVLPQTQEVKAENTNS